MRSTVRIGCSSAFWGDSIGAAHQLVKNGKIDYLVADYLAEVTMGILAKRRQTVDEKKLGGAGQGGFVAEFVTFVWKPLMNDILKNGIRVVTNAGGMDPVSLKKAIEQVCHDAGIEPPVVAAVYGDDILSKKASLIQSGSLQRLFLNCFPRLNLAFSHVPDGKLQEFIPEDKKTVSLNAYLGALPIKEALDKGAQVVVTGRCVDSAIVLGPLMHEFQWSPTDYNLLAAGSLAGHIIECGCQATGGNFTDWELSANSKHGGWSNMGYPIVECSPDGSFIVTKAPKTGGIVTVASVGEQMVYEIGDPSSYILPDVIVDLRFVKLKQIGEDKVHVKGALGRPPTSFLKVSGIYVDGYKVTGEIFIGGIDARKKVSFVMFIHSSQALAVGEAIVKRARKMIKLMGMDDFKGTNIEALGSEHTYGENTTVSSTREIVLRLSAHHDNVRALQFFLMEIAPSATCMAPGIIGVTSGRPRPTGNMVHVSMLVRKQDVVAQYVLGQSKEVIQRVFDIPLSSSAPELWSPPTTSKSNSNTSVKIPLIKLCNGRSGDKGDSANIGLICRDSAYYPYILEQVTEEKVANWMKHLLTRESEVKRYYLPGCFGVNFLITSCLGGGGLSSLQVDRQGKSYAQMLLSMSVAVPSGLLESKSKL